MRIRCVIALVAFAVGCSETDHSREAKPAAPEASAKDAAVPPATSDVAQRSSLAIGPLVETSCTTSAVRSADGADMLTPACAYGCMPRMAAQFDEARRCIAPLLLACVPNRGENSVLVCSKRRADGLIIRSGGPVEELLGPAWQRCTDEDWTMWSDMPCPE